MTDSEKFLALKQRLAGRNLYLVGMMGSGKTATGPYIAKELSYSFVDSDFVIEKASGMKVEQIFQIDGEEGFRDLETKVLKEIGQRHSLVVSTGGGVILKTENWGILHQGIVIWIDPGINRIFSRLQADNNKRPLLHTNDLYTRLEDLNKERSKFYMEADLHLKVEDEPPSKVARIILENLPSILTDEEDLNEPQTTLD